MTAPRSGRPDPDGHHDDLPVDDLDGLWLQAPDDARELDADRDSWLREVGGTQEQPELASQQLPRIHHTGRRWPVLQFARRAARQRALRQRALTAFVVLCAVAAVAVSGLIGGFRIPASPGGSPAAPLAVVHPQPGQVGGLLPVATLVGTGAAVATRSLRPAVIALVPNACTSCLATLQEVRRQTSEFGLRLTLVGASEQAAQLGDLRAGLGTTRVDALTDPQQVLATTFASGLAPLTLLLVRDDGVVVDVVTDPHSGQRFEPMLVGLGRAFASTT
ncbi:MAG TPA: hypothetical protein VMT27_06385 [Actinomycetes bacterium]|nr:hypothetical protein [Actinomycetes bacterium]